MDVFNTVTRSKTLNKYNKKITLVHEPSSGNEIEDYEIEVNDIKIK